MVTGGARVVGRLRPSRSFTNVDLDGGGIRERSRSREDYGGVRSVRWGWFYGAIALLALLGLGLAVAADSPVFDATDPYVDAAREVGGALVAGAVVALAVVWFEERREDERIEREERRDDQAARRAWQREVDVRLVTIMRSEISAQRPRQLRDAKEDHQHTLNPSPLGINPRTIGLRDVAGRRPFWDAVDEAEALVSFLRDDRLTEAIAGWAGLLSRVEDVSDDTHYTRNMFEHALEMEAGAWDELTAALDDYIDQRYPTEDST